MLSFNKLYEQMQVEYNLNLNDSGLPQLAANFNCYCRTKPFNRENGVYEIIFSQQDNKPVKWKELAAEFHHFLELFHLELVNQKTLHGALIFYVTDKLEVPHQ